jgi:hypothetical protein
MKTIWGIAAMVLLASTTCVSAQQRGDWVLARWKGEAYWFPGVVQSRDGDWVTVAYDDGTRETLRLREVRSYDWRQGSRVQCQWNGGNDWYEGRITAMSGDGVTIDVLYDDGDRERTQTAACRSQ